MTNREQLDAHLEAMIETEVEKRVKEELEKRGKHIPSPVPFKTNAIPVKIPQKLTTRKRKYVYLTESAEFILDYDIGKEIFLPLIEENIDTCETELDMKLESIKMTPTPLFIFGDKDGIRIGVKIPTTEKVVF